MCRLFFYISSEDISLKYILNDAPHSIKNQSYKDPYLPELDSTDPSILSRNPKENLDGYGILFKINNLVHIIKSKKPIINTNTLKLRSSLLKKIENISSNYIIVFIRKNNYKDKYPNQHDNVQPFIYKNWYFMNNGEFNEHLDCMKTNLIPYISNKYLLTIGDNLDSKILFSLIMTYINKKNNFTFDWIKEQIIKVINHIYSAKPKSFNITTNFILSNLKKNIHIALRYRTCEEIGASLYYLNFENKFMISSEPIDYSNGWKLLNNELLIIKDNEYKIFNL